MLFGGGVPGAGRPGRAHRRRAPPRSRSAWSPRSSARRSSSLVAAHAPAGVAVRDRERGEPVDRVGRRVAVRRTERRGCGGDGDRCDGVDLDGRRRASGSRSSGPNGAGKSTLLRAVGGLLPLTGAVSLFGTPSRRAAPARAGPAGGDGAAVPGRAARHGGARLRAARPHPVHRRRWAGSRRADLAPCDDVLDRLDLSRFAGRQLDTLSGGERQRVFLARALAQGATAAAARRADQRAGHRPPAGGAGAGRPAAPGRAA